MTGRDRALNMQHLHNPQPGDYWHELFTPIARILAADERRVLLQDYTNGNIPTHREVRDDDPKPIAMTREEFAHWLSYKSIEGTWADVSPRVYPPSAGGHDG